MSAYTPFTTYTPLMVCTRPMAYTPLMACTRLMAYTPLMVSLSNHPRLARRRLVLRQAQDERNDANKA